MVQLITVLAFIQCCICRLDIYDKSESILEYFQETSIHFLDEKNEDSSMEKDVKAKPEKTDQECCPIIELYAFGEHSVFYQTDPNHGIWANDANQRIVFNEYFNIWQIIEDGRTTMGTGMYIGKYFFSC